MDEIDNKLKDSVGVAVGDLIRIYRQKRKITQAELAAFTHISVSTVSNYENGKTIPDIITLKNIYSVLNISPGIKIKQPSINVLDLYDANDGIKVDENGRVIGNIKQVSSTLFELYGCRKLDYCCIMKDENVYLMHNTNILKSGECGLVKFFGADVFVIAEYDGERYSDISSGNSCERVEAIIARSLGTVEFYVIK